MNKKVFSQYISESNFRELFIREMGWNNPKGQTAFDITIEETVYAFQQIADRSGFQVLTCGVKDIPTASLCKKIDTRLRKQANDYICIYYLLPSLFGEGQGVRLHHLWVVPVKKVEKRDLVLVEYDSADKANFLFEKIEDMSFDLDEHTTIMDVKERVQAGFIINSEKITKDFYTGFRKEHTNFAKYITGIDDEITDLKKNRNKQWYTSVMLNRLMFCYFIQKKGFLDRNVNYLRDKLAWVKNEKGEDRFYGTFYQGFLISLFHDGLNSPRHEADFTNKYGRIPYLNGGMFSIHELEEQYPTLDIADEAFESLFAFFDQWHWHLDDRLTASGKDINPDVLGYIFEQYINDRAQMGAYYTKEDITEYIGRNTILPFLMDATKKAEEKPFKTNGEVWQFLRDSGDTYIYDAVKKGKGLEIPEDIKVGLDTTKPNLLERRSHWNEKTPEAFALPTEIWRETIERLQRYESIKQKIENGEITEINDFITYNLDIRQFVQDLLAQTEDHLLVKHFYAQLRKVTILDPTCGSGAFLFAALNILEPLYEVCIDRMQGWNSENPHLFKEELEEINGKYRSNIRYFIYKNIILRNLYGVDIMVEATEIAKLRLFLKMVAVVDVNPRDPNLGLDPLPDIDFNIRCGNTLVGYATEKEMEEGVKYMDMFARQEFEDKVYKEMDIVSRAYNTFKTVQLNQHADIDTYKTAKKQLKDRLASLNALLDKNLHKATSPGMDFGKWKSSHQPFHWLAEYFDIINGNLGFDIIIGNPPYVVYTRKDKQTKKAVSDLYKLRNYNTIECNNLYAFVIERSFRIMHKESKIGVIIPISAFSNSNMTALQKLLKDKGSALHVSTFHQRPAQLFNGVLQRLSIFVCSKGGSSACPIYTTGINRWYASTRDFLFQNLSYVYTEQNKEGSFVKIGSPIEKSIKDKFYCHKEITGYQLAPQRNNSLYYRSAGGGYWIAVLNDPFDSETTSNRIAFFNAAYNAKVFSALLNSSLFWWYYSSNYDLFNFTEGWMFGCNFNYPPKTVEEELVNLSIQMEKGLRKNAQHYVINSKTNGLQNTVTYRKYYSKDTMDAIDKVLAKHYGFTEEELDFIINYDIKYRMGDELGEDSESGIQPKQEAKAPLSAKGEERPKNRPFSEAAKQQIPQQAKQTQNLQKQAAEPKGQSRTMIVRQETLERIKSGEKTTFKRYLDDEAFAKEVLVTENGKIKLSGDHCPYTAKTITSIKFVCDGESLMKAVTKISFRTGLNPQGKTAWKIIFHLD